MEVCRSDYIRFYHLRAYDRINAPWGKQCSLCGRCANLTPRQTPT